MTVELNKDQTYGQHTNDGSQFQSFTIENKQLFISQLSSLNLQQIRNVLSAQYLDSVLEIAMLIGEPAAENYKALKTIVNDILFEKLLAKANGGEEIKINSSFIIALSYFNAAQVSLIIQASKLSVDQIKQVANDIKTGYPIFDSDINIVLTALEQFQKPIQIKEKVQALGSSQQEIQKEEKHTSHEISIIKNQKQENLQEKKLSPNEIALFYSTRTAVLTFLQDELKRIQDRGDKFYLDGSKVQNKLNVILNYMKIINAINMASEPSLSSLSRLLDRMQNDRDLVKSSSKNSQSESSTFSKHLDKFMQKLENRKSKMIESTEQKKPILEVNDDVKSSLSLKGLKT